MTIAHVGNLGTAQGTTDNVASFALTTTANAAAGSLVVLLIAVDNIQTSSGNATSPQVASVQNSGSANTWTRAKGQVQALISAQTGSDCEIWYSLLTNAIASGQTITATFQTASAADAYAMTAKNFSVGVANTIAIEGTPGGLSNSGAAAGSLNVTTSNIECLRVRAIGSESNSTTVLTPTAGGWAIFPQAVSGAGTSTAEQGIRGEWIISTATGAASAPTGGAGAVDNASVYVAFREVFTNRTLTQTARFDDGETFHAGALIQDQFLTQSALYTDTDTFYTADIGVQALTQTARLDNANSFGGGIDSYTKLLIHADGADGSTAFIDEAGHTVTTISGAQVDTAQSVFGGASALFLGSASDQLQIPGADFAMPGDFVMECRVRLASFGSWQCFISTRLTAGAGNIFFGMSADTPVYHSVGTNQITGPGLSVDTWYHIAIVRSAGVARLFVDGIQGGSDYTVATSYPAPEPLTVGAESGYNTQGWLDEIRISIGTDRGWFGGFTPPSSAYAPVGHVLTLGPPPTALTATRHDDADTFHTGTLTAGPVGLTASLYTDPDTFHTGILERGAVNLAGTHYDDADTFYPGTLVALGAPQPLTGDLFVDPDTFFTGTIGFESQPVAPSLPGGSSAKARRPIIVIDPSEQRKRIKEEDRAVLDLVRVFLDKINREPPWAP